MRLLILGGTIFLGRHVVAAARAAGHEVTVFSRGIHGRPDRDVEHVRGDRARDGDLAQLRGRAWDAVVDTCGFDPAVVAASSRLLAEGAGHLVFVSSVSVYADWPAAPVDEDSPLWPADPPADEYGPLKVGCERAVEAAFGDRATLVRAGLICGPNDNVFRLPWWIERAARGDDVLAPGEPARGLQLIDVRDLAAWIVRACEHRISGAFNATAARGWTTMGELLESAVAATGSGARLHWIPDEQLLAAGVAPWTDLPLWAPRTAGFAGTWSVATDRIHAAGLHCRPVAETVTDTWAWLQAGGADELGGWRAEHRPRGINPTLERRLLDEDAAVE